MMKTAKNVFFTFFITTLLTMPQNINAQQQSARDPGKRILQEFQKLEAQLGAHIHSAVLGAPNIDAMNRSIDEFMLENPAVKRVLRTNNGGFTVNDISSDSPLAPPRSLANQKWLQIITLSKAPYYSFDADSEGAISLFYAWPLLSGSDKSHFSGAFAAKIDLTTHIALIEEIAPFQLAYNGSAFFQHEWDEAEYNEEPLEIKGTENITIRTVKQIPVRQAIRKSDPPDSAALSSSIESAVKEIVPQPLSADAVAFSDNSSGNNNVKKSKNNAAPLKSMFQLFTVLLILVVVVMIIVVIYRVKNRASFYTDGRFFMDNLADEKNDSQNSTHQQFINIPSLKKESAPQSRGADLSNAAAKDTSISEINRKEPSSIKIKNTLPAIDGVDNDRLPPQPIVEELVKAQKNESHSRKNAKAHKVTPRDAALLQFLKSEFTNMENKIITLSDRIDKLEKR